MNKYISLVLLASLAVSCQMKVEPAIDANIDNCENCSMLIQNVDHGAVAIDSEEELHTFCSPVCYLITTNKFKTEQLPITGTVYLFDHNTLQPVESSSAFIVHGDFPTAMGHGLLAFAGKTDADAFAEEVDGEILSWDDLRLRYETPDQHIDLTNSSADSPQAIEVSKGQIISVTFANAKAEAVEIELTGYDFRMTVEPESEATDLFVADMPGQGFVFQHGNQILATLFVSGAHTSEEELYR